MSPELEQTLSMLSSRRSVLGYMLVTRGHHPSIIRHSGVVFEGEQGKRYAAVVARIVESVQAGLEEVRVDDGLTAAATGESDVVRWFLSDCRLVVPREHSNLILYCIRKG
jgi:dynein light chain roadblock-type